jgi:hypothetical protein
VLGGEMVRRLNDTPSLRKVPIDDLLFDVVKDGGPLPYGCDSEPPVPIMGETTSRVRLV